MNEAQMKAHITTQSLNLLNKYFNLLLPGIVLLFSRLLSWQVMHVYDDAFITLRYARHLAIGAGFVYQRGELVLGTTAPAFALLNSLFFILHLPMPAATVTLNILTDVVVLYFTIALMPVSLRQRVGFVFGLLFSLSRALNQLCIGAMETNLFIMLSLIAIFFYVRSRQILAIIIVTLSYFLRPESLILLGVFTGSEFLRGNKARALRYGMLAVCILGVLLGGQFLVYKQVLPQSVAAKLVLPKSPLLEVATGLLGFDPLIIIAVPLACFGFLAFHKESRAISVLGIWCAMYAGFYFLMRPHIWPWYGGPIQYTLLALGSLALVWFEQRVHRTARLHSLSPAHIAIAALPVLIRLAVYIEAGPSNVTSNIYQPLEKWCQRVNTYDTIMAYDIGAIGYYCSDAAIYDLAGLVTPKSLHLHSPKMAIQRYQPTYLFLYANKGYVEMMSQPPFANDYTPIARFAKTGRRELNLNLQNLPEGWTQDYILYKRKKK